MRMKKKVAIASVLALITAYILPLPVTPPLVASFSAAAAESGVYINEICSQNKSVLADGYGSYSDWIELYNHGNSAVELSGYGLSDDTANPMKWVFPDNTVIGAGKYLIVFASGNSSIGNELHASFSLSKNGETLVLSSPDGRPQNTVELPTLGEDFTYGRITAGGTVFEIMTPTPGAANATAVSAPVFSAESGFYGTNFSLSLSAASGTEIFFTTDGSDPTDSDTAQKYSSPITVQDRSNQPNLYSKYDENENSALSISRGCGYKQPAFSVDKATVVRAVAQSSDGKVSKVSDRTYFVTTGNLAKYKNYTIVSLVTNPDNLFDPDTGIYVTGNQFLEWKNSGSYNPAKNPWDTNNVCNYFSRGREWERDASVSVFENGSLSLSQDVGIRVKGASTRNNPQKSFNLYARSEYGASKLEKALLPENYDINGNLIQKYDSICLRSVPEEVRLRDSFAQGLIHDRENLTTADMKPCMMFLNGEFWGAYEITEKLSDYFIESNYDIPKENVAMIKSGELEEGTQEECDGFFDFSDNYSKMDLSDTANYRKVCDFIDIDTMIEHYAAGLYFGTYDWPNYNYGVWKNTGDIIEGNKYSDGKWRFITYDMDYTMGVTYASFGGVEGYAYDSFRHMNSSQKEGPTNLFIQLLKNADFRNKFVSVYCDYANEVLSEKKISAQLQKYSNEYSDLLAMTQLRWWGFFGGTTDSLLAKYKSDYQSTTLGNIRTFFNRRASYTLEDMQTYLGLGGTLHSVTLSASGGGKIKINSIIPDISGGNWSGNYYSDIPVTVTAIPDSGSQFTGWSGDSTSSAETITLTLSKAITLRANFEEKEYVMGDVDSSGSFDSKDVTALKEWILGSNPELSDWEAGNFADDSRLNSIDLCIMKRELLG